jgi:hypothetical protein
MQSATRVPRGDADVRPVRNAGFLILGSALLLSLGMALRHSSEPSLPGAGRATAAAGFSLPSPIQYGTATFYADPFHGHPMADGSIFDMNDPGIAASNSWPLGTRLVLRRIEGGPWDSTLSPAEHDLYFSRTIVVTVQDRGDFTHELDLSRAAFARLGRPEEGVIRVEIVTLQDALAGVEP